MHYLGQHILQVNYRINNMYGSIRWWNYTASNYALSYIELEPSEGTDTNQSRGRIRYGSHRTVKSTSDVNQYQPFTISGPVSKRSGFAKYGELKVSKSNVSLTPTEEIDEFVRAAQQRLVFKLTFSSEAPRNLIDR